MLKQTFIELAQNYSDTKDLIEKLWEEIEKNYTGKKRHYHNLKHLDNLLKQLSDVKEQIQDWDTILFTLFYHDIIYDALSKKNEENSAELAVERLHSIFFPDDRIKRCYSQIIATKNHALAEDNDTNLFTDADLSIFGMEWEHYSEYLSQVRKEYSIYPDLIYNPGRKKVLKHFLESNKIYKTDYFLENFEEKARENIAKEITML